MGPGLAALLARVPVRREPRRSGSSKSTALGVHLAALVSPVAPERTQAFRGRRTSSSSSREDPGRADATLSDIVSTSQLDSIRSSKRYNSTKNKVTGIPDAKPPLSSSARSSLPFFTAFSLLSSHPSQPKKRLRPRMSTRPTVCRRRPCEWVCCGLFGLDPVTSHQSPVSRPFPSRRVRWSLGLELVATGNKLASC